MVWGIRDFFVAAMTDASTLCGIASNLTEMVLFRVLQGLCGAMIAPVVLTNMMQVDHAELAERLTVDSIGVQTLLQSLGTGSGQIVAIVNGLVQKQSATLGYLDDFWLMLLLSLASIPLILLLRGPKKDKNARPKTKEELAIERTHAMAE